MDIFVALTIANQQYQDRRRRMDNERMVRDALLAHQQQTQSARPIGKNWRYLAKQVTTVILPG